MGKLLETPGIHDSMKVMVLDIADKIIEGLHPIATKFGNDGAGQKLLLMFICETIAAQWGAQEAARTRDELLRAETVLFGEKHEDPRGLRDTLDDLELAITEIIRAKLDTLPNKRSQ